MVEPVHTAAIALGTVRFFRSPLDRPDFPWHAADDLHAALGLAPELQAQLMAGLFRRWRDDVRTVDVGTERLVIGPHSHALGLVCAMDEMLGGQGAAERTYVKAAMAASEVMLAGLGPIERFQFMMAAAKGERVDG